MKTCDDGSHKLKAQIAPHGIEENVNDSLTSDCSTCSPTSLRIIESISLLFGWTLYKAVIESAFLQTGDESRDVYVKPPRES